MEGILLKSLLEPGSLGTPPIDFIISNHYTNKVSFDGKFNPLANDYFLGFLLAVFSTTLTSDQKGDRNVVLYKILDGKRGIKTIMLRNESRSGENTLIVRNFHFEHDPRQIKHGGLSGREKEEIETLLGRQKEIVLLEYLVYDINSIACPYQSEGIGHQPYVELLQNYEPGDEHGQAETFYRLDTFMHLTKAPLQQVYLLTKKGQYEDKMKNIIQLLRDGLKAPEIMPLVKNLDSAYEHGFVHGFFFSTDPIHRFDIKINAYVGKKNHTVLKLQKELIIDEIADFTPTMYYDLMEADRKFDFREGFCRNIIGIVGKWGSSDKSGKLLTKNVHNFIESFKVFGLKHKNINYLYNYFFGMFMAMPNKGAYEYEHGTVYYTLWQTTKVSRRIIIRVRFECILIINFDENQALDAESLHVNEFAEIERHKCVWIINILETWQDCRGKMSQKNIAYNFNVIRMDFSNVDIQIANPIYWFRQNKERLGTDMVKEIMLNLNFSNAESIEYVYKCYTSVISLMIYDFIKSDESSVIHILEGLFQQSSFIDKKTQVDIFYSKSVFCVRVKRDGSLIQINFMNMAQYIEYAKHSDPKQKASNYKVINLFYDYDARTGNISSHMTLGLDFNQTQIRSRCFDSSMSEYVCPNHEENVSELVNRKKRTTVVVSMTRLVLTTLNFVRLEQLASNTLISNFSNIIIDRYPDPFYTINDAIWTAILIHDYFVVFKAVAQGMETSVIQWKLNKIFLKAFASNIVLPVIGMFLAATELRTALQNYQDGHRTAFDVHNIVAAGVFLTTSAISLVIGLLAMTKEASLLLLVPFGKFIFLVGAAFYFLGHIWKIIDDFDAFVDLLSFIWNFFTETIPDFVSHPIDFLEKDQVEYANKVVASAFELMEKSTDIQNVFLTPACFEETNDGFGCHEIVIYFGMALRLLKKDMPGDGNLPHIPQKFSAKYKKMCPYRTDNGVAGIVRKVIYPHAAVGDYNCYNALGVGRIIKSTNSRPVSLYVLRGNSTVFAVQQTRSIFRLSGGRRCHIIGGRGDSKFIFSSSFEKCILEGNEDYVNTVDVSGLSDLDSYRIEQGKTLQLVGMNRYVQESQIDMYNIGVLVVEQHHGMGSLLINCSNVSIVVNERKGALNMLLSHPYLVKIVNRPECTYDLKITSHGWIKIVNEATKGKFLYTFAEAAGSIIMLLNGMASHSIMLNTIKITELRYVAKYHIDKRLAISFIVHEEEIIFKFIEHGADSTKFIFADGTHLTYKNGTFIVEIFYPKSIAQLWLKYASIFKSFGTLPLKLTVYSEREDDFFELTSTEIEFNKTKMPFSHFETYYTATTVQRVRCKPGYNVVRVWSRCCANMKDVYESKSWFRPMIFEMKETLDVLVIDFTSLIDNVKDFRDGYTIEMAIKTGPQVTILDVFVISYMDSVPSIHPAGYIIFNDTFLNTSTLYKKIKIMARSDFILKLDNRTGDLSVVPLPATVSPMKPIVLLDMHSVQKNQVIQFDDRKFANFDLVRLNKSMLLITDLATNMAKGQIFNQSSVPLLSVVIKNFTSPRMRTLTLKFEDDLEIDLGHLNETKMIEYEAFERKFTSVDKVIQQESFKLEHDVRLSANEASKFTTSAAQKPETTKKPKAAAKFMQRHHKGLFYG